MGSITTELFNILPYDIPEELFKQKIGTGDYLKQLQEEDSIYITGQGIRIKESFLKNHRIELAEKKKEELHLDIINNFYIPKLQNIKVVDYDDFVTYHNFYINLAYHYQQLSRYDDAIQQVSYIAKKMQYWGMKEALINFLNKLPDEKLNEESKFLKTYYNMFSMVLSGSDVSNDFQELKSKFIFLEQLKERDILLFVESKNLEGIFYRIFEKNIEKAVQIHKESIELINNQTNKENIYNTAIGRIFENLSFCYEEGNEFEKAKEAMIEAQDYLERGNDSYELAKMHFYKASFYYNSKSENLLWVPCLREINTYLEKHRFPDIERNLYNLLSRIEFERERRLNNYFKFKSHALDCDLVLYHEHFVTDFISIYNFILENKDEYKKQIVEGLKCVAGLLEEANMEDERLFIAVIEAFLNGEQYLHIKNRIRNQSLVKLFDELSIEQS
jgi:hypothetical protein